MYIQYVIYSVLYMLRKMWPSCLVVYVYIPFQFHQQSTCGGQVWQDMPLVQSLLLLPLTLINILQMNLVYVPLYPPACVCTDIYTYT